MMKLEFYKSVKAVSILCALCALNACNYAKQQGTFVSTTSALPEPVSLGVAGIGGSLSGTGALSTPTGKGVVGRIQAAMGVTPLKGSFRAAYVLVTSNLSNSADPTQFSGGDSNMMLAYGACVDAYMGTDSPNGVTAPTKDWGLTTSLPATNSANKTALIAAGMTIMDRYTAGLASHGSDSAKVKSAVTSVVTNSLGDTGVTLKMAFITVCTAANTAGSTLLGF